jgi:hypothetical protein
LIAFLKQQHGNAMLLFQKIVPVSRISIKTRAEMKGSCIIGLARG